MADQEEVQLVIEKKIFTYSKELLISNSAFFDAMFGSNFIEKSQKETPLLGVDAFAFNLIVDYIKSGSKEITEIEQNTIKALNCAKYLQFREVEEFCVGELFPQICTKNCLEIYKAAQSGSELSDAAMTCATWNCDAIFDSKSFLVLEDLSDFLRRPELRICDKNEFIVWEKCIHPWIVKDKENRKPSLFKLITCMDFTNLELDDINKIIDNDLVSENAKVTDFLSWIVKSLEEKNLINIDYKDYINSLPDDESKEFFRVFFSKNNAVKRLYSGAPWFAAFNVDDDISGRRSTYLTILCYDCKSKTVTEHSLRKLSASNDSFCVGIRVCSVGYCLYILGGQYQVGSDNWNKSVWSYDTLTKKLDLHIRKLPVNRRNHMMCVVDSVIYLIGGYGNNRIALSSMDAYDTINKNWLTELPNSPFNGSGSCCVYNQTILVFVEDMIYKYNVVSKRWSSEEIHSTELRSYVSAVCHNDSVYLLRSYSNEVYTTNLCESRKNIRYFGSFQNNTENMCVANDALFSFSVDDNLKNKPVEDTINIIEVIPLSEESQKKYEEQNCTQQNSSNDNDLNRVNEDPGTSTEHSEDEPEYKKLERSKLNVEANHSQHVRHESKPERPDRPASDEDLDESVQQQHVQMSQGTHEVTPGEQQLQQSPKRGIQIWNSRTATPGFSDIPFITGSFSHGCSTLFKINGSGLIKKKN